MNNPSQAAPPPLRLLEPRPSRQPAPQAAAAPQAPGWLARLLRAIGPGR